MALKLFAGASKRKPDWLDPAVGLEHLVHHLQLEIGELFDAKTPEERLLEAADVANLAFMIAEKMNAETSDAGLEELEAECAALTTEREALVKRRAEEEKLNAESNIDGT